jgi:ABC-type cobalt transport system substrate-binding protein
MTAMAVSVMAALTIIGVVFNNSAEAGGADRGNCDAAG